MDQEQVEKEARDSARVEVLGWVDEEMYRYDPLGLMTLREAECVRCENLRALADRYAGEAGAAQRRMLQAQEAREDWHQRLSKALRRATEVRTALERALELIVANRRVLGEYETPRVVEEVERQARRALELE